MLFFKPPLNYENELIVYKIVFCVLLIAFEIVFWITQILTYRENKRNSSRLSNYKKANRLKSKKKKDRFTRSNIDLFYIVLGLTVCAISILCIVFGNVNNAPTVTLSITVCILVFSQNSSNKISRIINSNSLPLAIGLIIFNSIVSKELFITSVVMEIVNSFAP